MDPSQAAAAISAGGWPYLFTAAVLISGGIIGFLWKSLMTAKDALTTAKDQAIAREREFKTELLAIVGQHKDALDSIQDTLAVLRDRIGGAKP